MSALMVTLRRRSKRVSCAGPLPISRLATVWSGTLLPPAVGTCNNFNSSSSPRAARSIWVRIGMLRSSRLNFGSWVEVSPMVPTRTVVAMSAAVTPRSAARLESGRIAISGRRRPEVAAALPTPGMARISRSTASAALSSAAGLSLTSTSWKRLARLAAAEAHAQAGNRRELGREQALELALREFALALRHQLHGQRARAHLTRRSWCRSRRPARRCRSPPARR